MSIDFIIRMHNNALIMNAVQIKRMKQTRGLELIAEFVDGYAKDWYFAVGECFKDELDIKLTERKEKGKTVMRWTQGPYFCFKEGHIIYDTPAAYLEWGEALKHIERACSVLRATPNRLDDNGQFVEGIVTFKLMKPNDEITELMTIGQYDLSQGNFVNFLKTGDLQFLNDQNLGG